MDGDIIAKVPLSQRVALETPSDEREITKPIRQKSHIRLRDAEAARALGAFGIDTYSRRMRGASATAPLRASRTFYRTFYRPDRSNGVAGAVVGPPGRPFAVIAFTVVGGRITELDLVRDRNKLTHIAEH